MLRGPENGVPLLVIPALFEEMNRTRRLLALTFAALAAAGVRSWMPDLPGMGDHEDRADAMDLPRWRAALAALAAFMAAGQPLHLLSVRSGALLADAVRGAASLYCLAPQPTGAKALRDLWRARAAAGRESGITESVSAIEARSVAGETIEAAGYPIHPRFAAQLRLAALPAPDIPTRTAATAPGPGVDVVLAGPPLWRQAEPGDAARLAAALAADLSAWIADTTVSPSRP